MLGVKHSLDHEVSEAPWFYGAYAAALVGGALVVASGVNLVALSVGVQVMNAMLLPIVLGFLFLLARGLPEPWRLKGWYAWFAARSSWSRWFSASIPASRACGDRARHSGQKCEHLCD